MTCSAHVHRRPAVAASCMSVVGRSSTGRPFDRATRGPHSWPPSAAGSIRVRTAGQAAARGRGSALEGRFVAESTGGYDQSAHQFHVAHVPYETRDLPGSIAALKTSLRTQPKQERQGRLHTNAQAHRAVRQASCGA
ncbi:hypothetical protein ACFWAF_08790 [Streptomyces microflavus]|uniref:hypothetical protein n=1 Tax=Streptomyces microflavus TaxID=1919 RepID=UPI0036479ED4